MKHTDSFLKAAFADIWDLFEDDRVNEIKVSPLVKDLGQVWVNTGDVWYEYKNKAGNLVTLTDTKVNQIIEHVAGVEGKFAHKKTNTVEASIPGLEYRFTGVKQPTAVGCGTFNIRKHNSEIFTFEDYNRFGTFPESVNEMLDAWSEHKTSQGYRENFSVSIFGRTKSGKTAFQNFWINLLGIKYPTHNFVVIEDTRELILKVQNYTRSQCTEYTNMDKLLRNAKRQSPDYLIIGEVRSGEAALVLESALIFNTIFGMHAKNFESAVKIMEAMILKNEFVNSVDKQDICDITGWLGFQNVPFTTEDQFGNQVQASKKRMTEMVELFDYDKDKNEFQYSTLYRHQQ
jgi:type IV secretory pathway ATPase VirB11/archaellum biosynthesis ATPase